MTDVLTSYHGSLVVFGAASEFSLVCVCSYIREKEMEEEVLMQRREEEGKGRERRKALLEKEERKWKELEISLLSSIPNAGSRDAAAMAAAVRAVGGDSALEDSFARDRVSSIARHIRKAQLARRAEQVLSQLIVLIFFFHNGIWQICTF